MTGIFWQALAAAMWALVLAGHPACAFLAVGCNLLGVVALCCPSGEEEDDDPEEPCC